MISIRLIVFGAILPFICTAAFYEKVIIQDQYAVCLDGSPGVYYFSKGTSPTKFMIIFEGGGWCGANTFEQTLQTCYQRSLLTSGTSKNYPQNYHLLEGLLSSNSKNSFAEFNKAFFKYCDGAGHQGTRSEPYQYKGAKLYFRGRNLTISKLMHLEKVHGLFSKSTEIMVTSGSAGGLAAFTWADYIRNQSHHKNVYSVPDSGVFLDSVNFKSKESEYKNGFINLFKLANVQIDPPNPQCILEYKNQPYKCLMAEYLHPFIKTPLFVVQSLYDSWSLVNILGIDCISKQYLQKCSEQERAQVEEYHKNTSIVLEKIGSRKRNGYWAPVCINHGYVRTAAFYNPQYAIPMLTDNTANQALNNWVLKKSSNHRHMDKGKWPEIQG